MHIKYSPCKSNTETTFRVKSDNVIIIDNEEYEFDLDSIVWDEINTQTNGKILNAYRENGQLYLTILRLYKDSCPWDDTLYHEVLS